MPYSFEEHTADIRMRVSGNTLEELFRDALLGMVGAMKPTYAPGKPQVKRSITVEAADATALLVDFLNEALVWMQIEREAYTSVQCNTLTEQVLQAQLGGCKTEEFGEDIKAVTYHEAEVRKNREGRWETNIVFDI